MGLADYRDDYSGGDFVFYNNGSKFNLLTTNSWDYTGGGVGDAAFKASFSSASVPEPASTLGILAIGALGAGSMLKRKQQQKA